MREESTEVEEVVSWEHDWLDWLGVCWEIITWVIADQKEEIEDEIRVTDSEH